MIQHLSIRIPWHDNCWNGTVCKHPELNQDCRVLRAVAKDKNDSVESECAGQAFCAKNGYMPPCLRECGTFMSCNSIETLPIEHPYTYDAKYKHISDTKYHINAFSFTARPYAWVLRENAKKTIDDKLYYTGYDDSIEVDVGSGAWVSNGINQKKIFDYFYRDVKAGSSIVVAYAKSVPFVETAGRIVLGIGIVEGIEEAKQYEYNRELCDSDIRSYLWERQINHSIRTDRSNGFLLPVGEIQKYLYDHPEQSPNELVVIAPDGYFDEFSYATEHLSCDALILVLNDAITVLNKYKQIGLSFGSGKDWDYCIQWCKDKLNSIWKERGAYPGLGTVLSAAGLGYGNDIAYNMRERFKDEELWDKIPEVMMNIKDYLPQNIPDTIIHNIGKNNFKAYYNIKKDVLKLLSRISLSLDQAKIIIDSESICRGKANYTEHLSKLNSLEDEDICNNPYLLYEQTRLFDERYRLSIGQIDIAMFKPYGEHSIFDSSDDERRIRAIAVSVLEDAAQQGNTLLTADELISKVNRFRSDVELELDISKFTLKAFKGFFNDEFINVSVAVREEEKKAEAYQLTRLDATDRLIREFVDSRVSEDIVINDNWEELLNSALEDSQNTAREQLSRAEKLKAVKVIAQSKISVLTGGAGTGKTSTLVALCLSESINKSGVLVLAPTGKARVVLESKLNENKIKYKANTVFGYLLNSAHCDPFTYRYYLSGKRDNTLNNTTVIIDESSMLTEEMFGALAETIALAKRVVFVGDPNQLPPIGAGKPFYELVEYLRKNYPDRIAELKISNRQKSEDDVRLDVEFARLFTFDRANEVSDDIFESIANDKKYIEFIKYGDNFSDVLLTTLKDALEMKDIDDVQKFDESLGGTLNGKFMNFTSADIRKVDSWQIISPYRNDAQTGTETLNRSIHQKYRLDDIAGAPLKYRTKHPLGRDGILLGEKVINLHNKNISGYPNSNCLNYVANGELGLVERIWEKPPAKKNTHQVRFTSQANHNYNYDSIINSENPDLELAYALTVHKAQGSGFATTILIINEQENGANAFISREMIYTALTRHTKKIFILYNKEPEDFKKYADPIRSDLARRLTNLFGEPSVLKTEDGYYAEHLIHITSYGEKVRSKSEVIIANELYSAGISFKYEQKLILPDGKSLLPDFTISLDGKEVIWEHLGMLSDPDYRRRWEEKKEKYLQCGISEANKNLIITSDKPNGGIDSCIIAAIISKMK